MKTQIGSEQVSEEQLSFDPSWVLEQEFEKEMDDNWSNAYEVVKEGIVPLNAKNIGCHVV